MLSYDRIVEYTKDVFENGIPCFRHKSFLLQVPGYLLSMLDVRLN